VAESLAVAAAQVPELEVVWHWGFDLERQHVGGQAVKNRLLDGIADGWVCVLDDDTVMHPEFLLAFSEFLDDSPGFTALVVSQQRTDGRVLRSHPHFAVPGMIDIGQVVLSRDLIGDSRIPIDYNGDGMFLQEVLTGGVAWIDEVLSLHNAISGVDVSV